MVKASPSDDFHGTVVLII